MNALGRLARAAAALLTALAALAAPPAALAAFVGWPLPHKMPTAAAARSALTAPLSDRFLLNTVACLAWGLWALFALALLTELLALLRGRTAPRLPGLGPCKPWPPPCWAPPRSRSFPLRPGPFPRPRRSRSPPTATAP